MKILKSIFSICLLGILSVQAQTVQWPEYLYEEWRKTPFPAKDVEVMTNPSPLLWPSVKHWENREVYYNVYLSRDNNFQEGKTYKSLNQRTCFFNPHRKLEPGRWFWKYEEVDNGKVKFKGAYSFIISPDSKESETPSFEEFLHKIPVSHPRIMNYGRSLEDIRREAVSHPLYELIVAKARQAVTKEIYQGAVSDNDPARSKALSQTTGKEISIFHQLLEGYILTGDKQMLDVLISRLGVLLTWPTNDLLGSQSLSALSMSFDVLYDVLPEETKQQILTVIERQLKNGLKQWPGVIETRHVENHFWQMEIAGNFKAALATVHHLKAAREMLEYTYGIYIARFPNLGTPEGGWSEGEGYYSVNQSSIVDMSLLLKTLGGVNIYQMEWFRHLTDYFIYFAPVAAPISGFGDMHERVPSGSNKGFSEMLVLGHEENNREAFYRLFSVLRPVSSFYGEEANEKYDKEFYLNQLSNVEPWYQIVNNIRLNPEEYQTAPVKPFDKVFYGVGLGALHTTVLNPATDATVFFRSSPFGAKGHMHANQNSFNISRKGERLFYSTGYYTSFSDPHALSSYRHTRAHNTILVNGCGQAFGHEGYGCIKRHIEGESLSYICGDATPAYHPTVDKQFIGMCSENGIEQTAEHGFADAKLKKFERHLTFVRPDIVIIYDVLESENPSDWSFLLHTVQPSILSAQGELSLATKRSQARANVYGSSELKSEWTDQFHSPAIDFKKKYKNGVPLQYHATYTNRQKTDKMRFLAIIRLSDEGVEPLTVESKGKNQWKVGNVDIEAEMDNSKPARAVIKYKGNTLSINKENTYTTLQERSGKSHQSEDTRLFWGNYVW
ncbi:DUF4962 domain-containing protein [Bacteroides nordii]|uniref:DUF4962 domain-containing protein n=1 Tax=Bacteroides nordii TaxID=291645 RepID=UPI002A80D64F|nr:DUF4962 domain-containing protein [Bacteroides nordii]